MAGRRFAPSEVSDRYETRRDYARSEIGRRDDRIWEEELEYRSRAPARERERTTVVKEEVRVKERSPPDFLREDYGRTTSGPVVLRAREREDFEFVPRPRRRSPSPELERRIEREEIIVRKEPEIRREPPPPPPPREYEREEIIVRREDRAAERARPPPPREVERDEFIVRREERGGNPRYSSVYERDEVIDRRPPPRDDYEREEIIIRRDREESRDPPRYRGRDDPYALPRAVSHERERSRMGRGRAGSDTDEIIIRRDEREGRNGREREREEIIIRRHDSRSPSPASTRGMSVRPPPEPPIINAPAIHQEVITHHRHVDHGYELALAPIAPPARFRPPSPPTPPQEEERIEIRRRGEKNGRAYDEDIIIDRNQSKSAPPIRDRQDDDSDRAALYPTPAPSRRPAPPERWRDPRDSRDIQEEAEYYNQRALERTYPGEGYHGSTADWAIVDVPPGTRRVRMDGAGGGAQEITWQRYNGVRRSKFMPDVSDEGYGSEVGRPAPVPVPAPAPAPAPAAGGEIGRRYAGVKDPREGMWTEITKDLVVKEAITEAGYEFEETDDFFYVIAYLKYVSSAWPDPC